MLVYLTLFCCMLAETFVRDFMSPNSSITEWIWNSEYVGMYMIFSKWTLLMLLTKPASFDFDFDL